MPADADALLAVQPGLAHPFAAGVLKERRRARRIAMAKDHVGNQLLERRVLLDLGPRAIARVLGAEQLAEIALALGREPLKMPESMKQLGWHDQDMFRLDFDQGGLLV